MKLSFSILFLLVRNCFSTIIEKDFLVCNVGRRLVVDEFCGENSNMCLYQKSLLQSYLDKEDSYNIFRKDIVVYSINKQLFYTECTKVEKIDVNLDLDNQEKCYIDIYIYYELESVVRKGFLNKNGIIRQDTSEIECQDNTEIFYSISKKKILTRNKNTIKVVQDKNQNLLKIASSKIEKLEYYTGLFTEKTDEVSSFISTAMLILTWLFYFLYQKFNTCFKKMSIIQYAFQNTTNQNKKAETNNQLNESTTPFSTPSNSPARNHLREDNLVIEIETKKDKSISAKKKNTFKLIDEKKNQILNQLTNVSHASSYVQPVASFSQNAATISSIQSQNPINHIGQSQLSSMPIGNQTLQPSAPFLQLDSNKQQDILTSNDYNNKIQILNQLTNVSHASSYVQPVASFSQNAATISSIQSQNPINHIGQSQLSSTPIGNQPLQPSAPFDDYNTKNQIDNHRYYQLLFYTPKQNSKLPDLSNCSSHYNSNSAASNLRQRTPKNHTSQPMPVYPQLPLTNDESFSENSTNLLVNNIKPKQRPSEIKPKPCSCHKGNRICEKGQCSCIKRNILCTRECHILPENIKKCANSNNNI